MSKLLSIIVPLYNSAEWLEKCLMSALNQDISEEQLEIICINDGSPDNSADIAREIAKEHPSIIVLDQENQGPSGARNNGMRHATGKYLAFLDPDDYLEPHRYASLIRQMEEEQLDMLRFNYQIVDENDVIHEQPLSERMFDYTPGIMSGPEFLANRLNAACNIWRYIYRTDIIVKNNIWCFTGDYFDDTPWLPLVLMKAERLNITDTIVYDYLERSDSLVNATSPRAVQRKTEGHFLLLKLLEDELSHLDELLPSDCNAKDGVRAWYRNMEAHSVISLLSLTACYNYRLSKEHINRLRAMKVLPVIPDKARTSPKSMRKMRIMNISPILYCLILHLKNSK